ncbi:MAG TPA: hypothetical protein ENH26_02965 [Candidatus Wolfebacteria bacterium]|nr:hypothetical protein [Candidatus Wolfebacteria bacterium]
MSLVEEILTILTDYSGGYKLMRRRMMGYTGPIYSSIKRDCREINDTSLRSTFSRLKKQGLIDNNNGTWKIKNKGREYLKNIVVSRVPHFGHLKNKDSKKEMIIIFDIPENRRGQRNWLRAELIALDFAILQKSVWLGPSPLPKEFIKYLNNINILQYLKFFKATEKEIV